jgi:hypothetical protein
MFRPTQPRKPQGVLNALAHRSRPQSESAFPSNRLIAIVLRNELPAETFFEAVDPQQCFILFAGIQAAEIVCGKPLLTETQYIGPVKQTVSPADAIRNAFVLPESGRRIETEYVLLASDISVPYKYIPVL